MIALVLAVSAMSIAAWARSRHGGAPGVNCMSVTIASTMGGATITKCDAAAVSFCRENANDAHIAEACRREGF